MAQLEEQCLHTLDFPGEGTGLTISWKTEGTASCLPGGWLISEVLLSSEL